jgi:hypothetical protein
VQQGLRVIKAKKREPEKILLKIGFHALTSTATADDFFWRETRLRLIAIRDSGTGRPANPTITSYNASVVKIYNAT